MAYVNLGWDVYESSREKERGNEVGVGVTPGDRVPYLALLSSLPGHIDAKGPDSVPAKHGAMFSEWLQEQIGPKSFHSFLKYNKVSTLCSFGNPGPHVGNTLVMLLSASI